MAWAYNDEISETIYQMKKQGFDCFKMKVGQSIEGDKERLSFIREVIGYDKKMMLDCNQFWGLMRP